MAKNQIDQNPANYYSHPAKPRHSVMTWRTAYRIVDQQIAFWQRTGVTSDEVQTALRNDYPIGWEAVRVHLARWAIKHGKSWEE